VHYHLGRARAKAERGDAARAAFQAALRDAAGTPFAKEVEATLYELEKLGCGHPAPAFAGTARDGKRVALEDYRGRVLLLVFWAST
jgi:cytochrome oxidase Cu insertion factor (SCO1/SenC/PrrC family)